MSLEKNVSLMRSRNLGYGLPEVIERDNI